MKTVTVEMGRFGLVVATLACMASLALPARAWAAAAVFDGHTMNGQPLTCTAQTNGVRVCVGDESGIGGTDLRFASFDGTPLQVYVTLPAVPATGTDGGYPLVVQNHGWGDPPTGPDDAQYGGPTARQWATQGYAVLQFAARGWGNSCGSPESRLVNVAACLNGYLHLDDYRFEARDVQYAVGLLVDEGYVDANRIGVTGESYGAGMSIALATLKDRVMNADGSLSPWLSPAGTPLHVAAAAPFAGWTDLVYALRPNGRTLDTQLTSPTDNLSLPGVLKLSIVSGLYAVGTESAYYALPGTDPQADFTSWYVDVVAGEPNLLPLDQTVVQQMAQYRSPYYLLIGAFGFPQEPPAPLLMINGFTDDVFPADEILRYYNYVRAHYPDNPISLMFGDMGHQRADNPEPNGSLRVASIQAFFDHYVKGTGAQPTLDVTALTQTCPATLPSGGPYSAATWEALHPGEVVYQSAPAQTVLSTGGDPVAAAQFDPIGAAEFTSLNGQGLACQAPTVITLPGVATYTLPTPTGAGYTLLGAPTVTADLNVTGVFAYIAARLLDFDPASNTETLVARGLYRIDPNAPNGRQTFQLHPNGWHFVAGHKPRLELLGMDAPYARPSNGVFSIAVSNLQLQLPVHEVPGAPGTPPEVTSPGSTGSSGGGSSSSSGSSGGSSSGSGSSSGGSSSSGSSGGSSGSSSSSSSSSGGSSSSGSSGGSSSSGSGSSSSSGSGSSSGSSSSGSSSSSGGNGTTTFSSGGGGGALGWLTLLPLSLAALWRRRRSSTNFLRV